MIAYIISAIIIAFAITNFILGIKLYEKPKENGYFANVGKIDFIHDKYIMAEPKYVVTISVITGILIGLYLAYANSVEASGWVFVITTFLLLYMYLSEITKRITFKEGKLTLSQIFYEEVIEASSIKGMYIYSYNKKFLKSHAYTTKLVITDSKDKTIKFTISSLDNRAVLNMMKETFGVNSYKMFISRREELPTKNKTEE